MITTTQKGKSRARAFSLPEIAIAVAIAALGITSVLGLLPSGLNNLRQAGDTVSMARIFQQMTSEVQSSDWGEDSSGNGNWSKLQGYHMSRRYFDGDGTEIQQGDSGFDLRMAYVAMFEIKPINVTLPSSGATPQQRPDMKNLIVHIAVTTRSNYEFGRPNSSEVNRAYTLARQY